MLQDFVLIIFFSDSSSYDAFCVFILDHHVLPPPFQNIIIERVKRQEETRERTEQTLAALSLSLFDNVSLRVISIQESTVIMARS